MPACDGELRLQGVSDLMKIQGRVGPSRLARQGLFAAQDIAKGTWIMQYMGEKIASRERARRLVAGNAYIFYLTYRYAIDGQALDNSARYINHACDPTCEVEKMSDTIWIVALRDIPAGEELRMTEALEEHFTVIHHLAAVPNVILQVASELVATLRRQGKIVLCGNGGSASNAQHMCR